MNTKPVVRLHLYFATENSSAVILRRARDREYSLILWDRETDRFVEGQWLRKHVAPDYCSVSPDGRHFLYHVRNAKPDTPASESYTVISQPPYFTALALFPQGSTFAIGGEFLDSTFYRINGDAATHDIVGQDEGLFRVFPGEVTKDCRTGLRLINGKPAPFDKALRERLLAGERAYENKASDLYDTQGGCLYRRRGLELELIRDFRDMEARYFRAPYDTRCSDETDTKQAWHPSDGEAR